MKDPMVLFFFFSGPNLRKAVTSLGSETIIFFAQLHLPYFSGILCSMHVQLSKSGTKKEPKPKLLSLDIFWWGRGLPREGVGAKKFGISLETQGIKLFWRDIPKSCRDIPEAPEKFEKKMFGFNFWPAFKKLGTIISCSCSSGAFQNEFPISFLGRAFVKTSTWWTFQIFFIFFCSGRGEGESEAPGGAGGSVFYWKSQQGGGETGRGRGAGRVSAANWGILGAVGQNIFCGAEMSTKSNLRTGYIPVRLQKSSSNQFRIHFRSVTLHELFSDASMHSAVLLSGLGLHSENMFWIQFQLVTYHARRKSVSQVLYRRGTI